MPEKIWLIQLLTIFRKLWGISSILEKILQNQASLKLKLSSLLNTILKIMLSYAKVNGALSSLV